MNFPFKLQIYFLQIFITNFQIEKTGSFSYPQNSKLETFLTPYVKLCTPLYIMVSDNFKNNAKASPFYLPEFVSYTYQFNSENNSTSKFPKRLTSRRGLANCIIVIIQLKISSNGVLNLIESIGQQIAPTNAPFLFKNEEKVIFISETDSDPKTILGTSFAKELKYKVLIQVQNISSFQIFTTCQFCGSKSNTVLKVSQNEALFQDFHQNFHHSILRVSIGESIRGRINYTFVPEQGRYVPTNGMLTPVLKYLSKKLNFSYEIVPSQRGGGTGIKLSNGSWNGMVADILMGDAEVALSVAQSFDREQVVGISPLAWEHLTLVVAHGKLTYPTSAVFWPLSPEIWALNFIFSLISILFLYLSHNLLHPRKEGWPLIQAIESTISIFIGQSHPLPNHGLSISTQIYLSIWFISSISVSTAYLSKLVNFLTFPVEEQVPQKLSELVASSDNYEWGLAYVGGVAYALINSTNVPVFQKIMGKMEVIVDHGECYRRTLRKNFVCISYASLARHYIVEEPELSDKHGSSWVKVSPHIFASFPCGIMTAKRVGFSGNLERAVRPLVTMGFVAMWEEQDFNDLLKSRNIRMMENLNVNNSESSLQDGGRSRIKNLLGIRQLKGAIVIFYVGTGIATTIFLVEFVMLFLQKNFKIFTKLVNINK